MFLPSVTGYAAREKGRTLEPYTYESPKLGDYDIQVRVTHCGLCYSDVQAIDDYYSVTPYPFVPGHEVVGHVSATGSSVSGLKEGDRVGIGWQARSCGECEWCRAGEEQLCDDIVLAGTWMPHGGFASSVVVDSRFAYLLPESMPSEVASVLLCAGITVFNPLKSYLKRDHQKIAIIGIGGLGHLAIQFARAMGYEVTVISSSPNKKNEALSFGADYFITSDDTRALMEHEFYFDTLLCTAHGGIEWEALFEILKKKGTLILVGFPDVKFNATDLVVHELSLAGSFIGSRATMKEMLAFAGEHDIKPRIELMPMSKLNEAIERVRQNKARYRIVLYNDG